MTKSIITKHKISRNKYLNQIEPFKSTGIPTDIILFKILPGLGATRCEIEFPRDSIILEPNVPVIKGKSLQYKGLVCGIYESITTDDIVAYLNNDVQYKKLIVTPESFWKVKEAIHETSFDLYADFFLLFDECEKIIQDISYRPNINLPMDDFFSFKQKAFVSATPIMPSDPRFKANHFEIHRIEPSYNYSENLRLIITNNVLTSLKKLFDETQRDMYFIFLNSTDTINDVIRNLNIHGESMVFCADNSRKKLVMNGYLKHSVKTELSTFKKYNFFTSRFFSAVDIEYPSYKCNPTIIMISEVIGAEYSMLDPYTESVQIQGRFRVPQRKSVKKDIVHIANINKELSWKSREQTLDYLKECHTVYKVINRYCESATTLAAKEVLRQMLNKIDYAKFLKLNTEERNYDMVDNLITEELVKSYYQSGDNLIKAYSNSEHFNLNCEVETYSFTDSNRQKANQKNIRLKSLYKLLSETLQQLHIKKLNHQITDFQYQMEIANLQADFPKEMGPINRLGIDASAELDFDIRLIDKKLNDSKKEVDHFGMMTFIHSNFKIGTSYKTEDIEIILRRGLKANKLPGIVGNVKYLRKFAELPPSTNRTYIGKTDDGKLIRGYKIIKFKDNVE